MLVSQNTQKQMTQNYLKGCKKKSIPGTWYVLEMKRDLLHGRSNTHERKISAQGRGGGQKETHTWYNRVRLILIGERFFRN